MAMHRYARVLVMAGFVVTLALLGGCSSKKSKKGGGGGGESFAPAPTEAPTLAGLPARITAFAGSGAGFFVGGDGGDVSIQAPAGYLLPDDGRGAPGIDSNFLPPALLAATTITFADLVSVDPAAVTISGGNAIVDLRGHDFFLPTGVTLNLSDAPFPSVTRLIIRALGAGDVIRIDGSVATWRGTAGTSVHLGLVAEQAQGTSVYVGGNISTAGGFDYPHGGDIFLLSARGDVLLRGNLLTAGVQGTPAAGNGGDVSITSAQANVLIAPGVIAMAGGSGTSGGSGGSLITLSGRDTRFSWGVTAQGGLGGTAGVGGAGGTASVTSLGTLTLNLPYNMNGGDGGSGGTGGIVIVSGRRTTGAIGGTAHGGASTAASGDGGNGGSLSAAGDDVIGFGAWHLANGGDGDSEGGQGGSAGVYCDARWMVNVLLTVEATGGTGDAGNGGNGGAATISGYGEFRNTGAVVDISGGASNSTAGGHGGVFQHLGYSGFGEASVDSQFTIASSGGYGPQSGGNGGATIISPSEALGNRIDLTITSDGGAGDTNRAGDAGSVSLIDGFGRVRWDMVLTLRGSMNGGDTENGAAGNGGGLVVTSMGSGAFVRVQTDGTVSARGGNATATSGEGGRGGFITVETGPDRRFESTLFRFDLRGGDCVDGDAGSGANSATFGQPGIDFACSGPVHLTGAMIDGGGGFGGNTVGGEGAEMRVTTVRHNIHLAGEFIFRGGDGDAGGGGAWGGSVNRTVTIASDSDFAQIAGDIHLAAIIDARGGDSLGADGNGGQGGTVHVFAGSNYPASGGDMHFTGEIRINGGVGTGTGFGGMTGDVRFEIYGRTGSIGGRIQANGGAGSTGRNGGLVQIYSSDVLALTVSGIIEANGGTGLVAGSGGQIRIIDGSGDYPLSVAVTATAQLRVNGGPSGMSFGSAGTINIESFTGTTVAPAAVIEAEDGDGTPQPGNISIS